MGSIDVHTHFIPDTYLAALAEKGITEREIGFHMARWEVQERLAVMDVNDIQTEMLSLSSPGHRGCSSGCSTTATPGWRAC